MTPRMQRFVDEYLVDLNATQAAIRAGYSEKTANEQGARLLANVSVKQEIEVGMKKRSEEIGVDARYVVETIVDTVERCRQARMVTDKKGNPIMIETPDGGIAPAYIFDANGVLRGCELLGKHIGMFIERKEVGNPGDFDKLDDKELDIEIDKTQRAIDETTRAIERARTKAKASAADTGKAKTAEGKSASKLPAK